MKEILLVLCQSLSCQWTWWHTHKETTMISGTGAYICLKASFGPTGHHHPRNSPLPRLYPVLSATAIFKVHLVVCEGVQHRLRFDHLKCVKMAEFQFFSIRETEKSRVGERRQSCCFLSKIPSWKRKRCRDATASSFVAKVRGEVFAHF
jgi:hypothetical protein